MGLINRSSAPAGQHDVAGAVDVLAGSVEQRMRQCVQAVVAEDALGRLGAANACIHHLASGGRRARARMGLHAALALGLQRHDAVTLATVVELLHNASLIHDDLQDRDATRRGAQSVWARYGDNVAVCAGDLMLAAAYGELGELHDLRRLPALLASVTARTRLAIHGQCADLAHARAGVDFASYCAIVSAKSGALLSLPLELPLLGASRDLFLPAARRAGESFAIGYQIADDIADVDVDAARPGRAASLNVVRILQGRAGVATALARARTEGLKHLGDAALAASELPDGAGGALRGLALKLSAQI